MAAVVALVALFTWGVSATRTSAQPGEAPAPAEQRPEHPITQPTEPTGLNGQGATEVPTAPIADDEPIDGLIEQLAFRPDGGGRFVADYDRALFGQNWFDSDRNGCDTRNDVLRRDLLDITVKAGTDGCKVLRGTLIDPYSGQSIEFVSGQTTSLEVQIDHLVPLAWAWQNGASLWSSDQRTAFANDPMNLLAVEGELNQEKSASGPAEWLPPSRSYLCSYAVGFTSVVVEYRLAVPEEDRLVLIEILRGC